MDQTDHPTQQIVASIKRLFWTPSAAHTTAHDTNSRDYKSSVAPILQQGREQIVIMIGRITSLLAIILFTLYLFSTLEKYPAITAMYAAVLCVLLGAAFHPTLTFISRFWMLSMMMYLVAFIDILAYGVWLFGPLFLLALNVVAFTLVGTRAGLFTVLLGVTTILGSSLLATFGIHHPPLSPLEPSEFSVANSLTWTFVFTFASSFVLIITNAFHGFIQRAWTREREAVVSLNQKAKELNVSLEREKQLATALQHSLDKERRLNQLRTQIINTVSHEFRTPLTTIKSSSTLLQDYEDRMTDEKREAIFLRIKNSVGRLTDFIGDITTVLQADEITQSSEIADVSFNELARQIETTCHENVQTDTLSFTYDETDGTTLATDPVLLAQACQMLVENALKFKADQVDVSMRCHNHQFILAVEDDGIGIPEGEEEMIFGLLNRGSNSKFVSGLGVGLFVVKNIVDLLGGTITVDGGSNTTFKVMLPLKQFDGGSQSADFEPATPIKQELLVPVS